MSDLNLPCLSMSHKNDTRLIWVKLHVHTSGATSITFVQNLPILPDFEFAGSDDSGEVEWNFGLI